MARRKKNNSGGIGHMAFFVGVIIAILTGLFTNVLEEWVMVTTLVTLGAIVGLINITTKETNEFLIAALTLMLAGVVNISIIPFFGPYLSSVLSKVVVFVVPAAVIVSLKSIWVMAKER